MQILIEISEEDKKELDDSIKGKGFSYFEKAKLIRKILFAVFHGKVIPKGHGRLIDADKILSETADMESNLPDEKDKQSVRFLRLEMESAPAIIEADNLSDKYVLKAVTRGNCMMCGKELTEGIFFCKECERKGESVKK